MEDTDLSLPASPDLTNAELSDASKNSDGVCDDDRDPYVDEAIVIAAKGQGRRASPVHRPSHRAAVLGLGGSIILHGCVVATALALSRLAGHPSPRLIWSAGDDAISDTPETGIGAERDDSALTNSIEVVAASPELAASDAPPLLLPQPRPEIADEPPAATMSPAEIPLSDSAARDWTPPADSTIPVLPKFTQRKPPVAQVVGPTTSDQTEPRPLTQAGVIGDAALEPKNAGSKEGAAESAGTSARKSPTAAVTPVRVAGVQASAGSNHAARRGKRDGYDDRGLPIPEYPPESRRRREQGIIELDVEVRADGSVGAVALIGDFPFPRLVEAATDAVRKASFEPATRNGEAVVGHIIVPFRFTME